MEGAVRYNVKTKYRKTFRMSKHDKRTMILAVPAKGLAFAKDIGEGHTFNFCDGDTAMAVLAENGVWFGPRPILEKDPTFRQIIPYVVLRCGDKFLTYTRGGAGGESRLHEKISMGFGGHVDIPDVVTGDEGMIDLPATLEISVNRELEEELPGLTVTGRKWIGLLADNSNEVGQVHVGLVGVWEIEAFPDQSGEDAVKALAGLTAEQLIEVRDRLENWSQIIVENLAEV